MLGLVPVQTSGTEVAARRMAAGIDVDGELSEWTSLPYPMVHSLDGEPVDGMLAVVHSVAFWAFNAVLTPLILLATLFLDYKQTLHDRLLGTVVVRTDRLS